MPLFSRKKDRSKTGAVPTAATNGASKPKWEDAWLRTRVDPDEVAELLHGCTQEIKLRALDVPFLLLPFRPASDPSAARTFVRNYFCPPQDRPKLAGRVLMQELRMTEVMVLVAVMKWCWARLPGGVVTWEVYQGFKVGEKDSRYARDAYSTFIPLSTESTARVRIINDFYDIMTALAAHGKTNGLGGHKLSRYAGWWAFDHYDTGKGFEAGYKLWSDAADAASHMFFAYLRSQAPEPGKTNGVLDLPRSLQQLVDSMDYPPPASIVSNDTTKVVMIVDVVSPTPFALLRRAKQFEYRDDDMALQHFAEAEDPIQALTEECKRVLRAISTANASAVSDAKTSTSLRDPSWSRFEDIGFGSTFDESEEDRAFPKARSPTLKTLNATAASGLTDLNRPTTPSWADFLSSGFADENGNRAPSSVLLPPDKALPPLSAVPRGHSSQSHKRDLDTYSQLEPGELASITKVELDDAFWWVWISSLAGEEPVARKAAFGRCALVETTLFGGTWMIMEEQVKGAAPEPAPGAYVAERKRFFSFTKKGRLTRRRSAIKKSPLSHDTRNGIDAQSSRVTLDSEKQAKIQQAAAELSKRQQQEADQVNGTRRGRTEDDATTKTNSVFTLGPMIKDEASPAMQWAKQYDKKTVREQYLGNKLAGKGSSDYLGVSNQAMDMSRSPSELSVNKDLPPAPAQSNNAIQSATPMPTQHQPVQAVGSPYMATEPPSQHVADQPSSVEASNPIEPVSRPRPQISEEKIPVMLDEPPSQIPKKVPRSNTSNSVTNIASVYEQKQALANESGPSKMSSERHRFVKKTSNSPPSVASSRPPPSAASTRPHGIKRLFGTMRKNKDTENKDVAGLPIPDSPTDEDPAVAAARRALEGRPPKPGYESSTSPPLSPNHFAKLQNAKATPEAPIAEAHEQIYEASEHNYEDSAPAVQESIEPTVQKVHTEPPHTNGAEQYVEAEKENIVPGEVAPPKTRRDEEFDKLSRVDTREREQADQEFSRFDQGPLVDQPAYVPAPPSEGPEYEEDTNDTFEPPHRPQHQSVYSNVTVQTDATEDEDQAELTKQVSPHDRWAQIRKNAAERAARASEDHARSRTETRTTDDGETSGEETIESRVARIKARVAELTGNMDAVRR